MNVSSSYSSPGTTINTKPKKLILHTQDGAIPYLTPHLLQSYFSPETNHLVQNHLILGIPIKDTCVIPKYFERKKMKTKETTKKDGPTNTAGLYDDTLHHHHPISSSLLHRLRSILLPGYSTLMLPTFDLLDDLDSYHSLRMQHFMNSCSKKRKKHDHDTNHDEEEDNDLEQQSMMMQLSSSSMVPSSNAPVVHSNTYCTNKHVSLVTPHGIQRISPQQYSQIIVGHNAITTDHHQQNHYVLGLFDQLQGTEGEKRRKHWIQRMSHWTARIMAEEEKMKMMIPSPTSIHTSTVSASEDGVARSQTQVAHALERRIIIPVDIHLNTSEREQYLRTVSQESMYPLKYFAILGWHRIDKNTWNRIQRREILRDMLTHLQSVTNPSIHKSIESTIIASSSHSSPSPLPSSTFVSAILCTPDFIQIMDAIRCGVDWVGTDIPQRWAQEGKALCLWNVEEKSLIHPLSYFKEILKSSGTNPIDLKEMNSQRLWIDLRDDQFVRDRDPLIPGCLCLACKNRTHSRAYIHHLIQAHELLAQILLFGHNLHQMLLFMEQLTYFDSIGKLDELCSSLEHI